METQIMETARSSRTNARAFFRNYDVLHEKGTIFYIYMQNLLLTILLFCFSYFQCYSNFNSLSYVNMMIIIDEFNPTLTTNVASSNPVYGEVYSIQHYVIKFVSDLQQVAGFLQVLLFHLSTN